MERLAKGMTKAEIEREISKWGEYVQIDNLTRFLKMNHDLPTDTKRFINQKLAEIYEKRGMFFDSALCCEKAGELCVVRTDKIKNFLKGVNNFIRGGSFDRADQLARKGMSEASSAEKMQILNSLREFYRQEAERSIKENKRSNAVKVYERMLEMHSVPIAEKNGIKEKLLKLYMDLGMVGNYYKFKDRVFKEERPRAEKGEEIEGLDFLYK